MFTDINDRKIIEDDLKKLNENFKLLSNTDGLTCIFNRRYLDEQLEKEYKRLCRTNMEMSLIMLDIVHFKKYNDFYGHINGDECNKKIANVIKNAFPVPPSFVPDMAEKSLFVFSQKQINQEQTSLQKE